VKDAWTHLSAPFAPEGTLDAFCDVVRKGQWDPGRRVKTLERWIAKHIDVPPEWVLVTDSCTTALRVAGEFLWRRPEEIRVCPLTYAATYAWADGRVQWVDGAVDADVEVELWGNRAEFLTTTILDAAHRFGDPEHAVFLKEGRVQAVCYSFNCQKEVPCIRGGAVVSPHVRDEWRDFIRCGTRNKVPVMSGGIKGGLPDPLAAWVIRSLRRLPLARKKRQVVLGVYEEYLGRWLLTKPGVASGHLAVLLLPDTGTRTLIRNSLGRLGIETSIHYPIPESARASCPNAWDLSERVLSIPCHSEMEKRHAVKIARAIARV
jgi:dTDP-4-amino-4,6-dideoxygalactose transaminase